MTAPRHHFHSLIPQLALAVLSLGVLLSPTPARAAERLTRQNRPGLRVPAGSPQRGASRIEVEHHELAPELQATTAARRTRSSAPAVTGLTQATRAADLAAAEDAALPRELWVQALQARPQTPTFGRPPPL